MSIRLISEKDFPRVVQIYNQAIEVGFATADTEPTTVEERAEWFRHHTEAEYPIYVDEEAGVVRGWCSLSPYRTGRKALRYTAEISYYVDEAFQRQGIATQLVQYAMTDCSRLDLKTLFAIILDSNRVSIDLLKKLGFEEWGHMPGVADFDGIECAHVYLGKRIQDALAITS